MERNLSDYYYQVVADLYSRHNITLHTLNFFDTLMYERDEENRFGKPMVWIGMYIAIATLFCIILMLADLVHGYKNRKLWFPCKYFTLNAATLSVIAVAMKIPMDLNNPMPGVTDQAAKYESMAYIIIMMANLLPSLASMHCKELVTNIIALDVLIITMVVNVCIQLRTGVLNSSSFIVATIDVIMLLWMLMIYMSTALTIMSSKQILESTYQASHEKALNELAVQQPGRLMVEKLKQYVNNHWIMAVSGSPQFMLARSATTFAVGVMSTISALLNLFHMPSITLFSGCESDYKWSTAVILFIQYIGVSFLMLTPIWRCYTSFSSKLLSRKWICRHTNVFKVESYCTQMLYDWKQSSIPLPFKSRRCKIVIHNLKVLILSFCIGFQMAIVVASKILSLILLSSLFPLYCFELIYVMSSALGFAFCVLYCWKWLKAMFRALGFVFCVLYCWKWLKAMFRALGFVVEKEPEQLQQNEDLIRQYVLQLPDDLELSDEQLRIILNSMNYIIQKAEKQQPTNLMKFLEGSNGFEGVGMCDMHQAPPSLADEYSDCWSLTVVTLTTIAISLPNIQKERVDKLLSSVSEGLAYVTLVEESLNSTDDYVKFQKVSKMLWLEVEVSNKWLGNNLQNTATQVNSIEQILQWFIDTAKNLITEVENTNTDVPNGNSICRSVSANSMYRITQAILVSYHPNTDEISQEELFMRLSSMISDTLAACLTNLPQVIALKCHTNAIEKREASVHGAAQLLGQTMEIINSLQDRELPNLNPDELPFINKWRDYFKHPIP